jgi:hypothetical protein
MMCRLCRPCTIFMSYTSVWHLHVSEKLEQEQIN